jgi:hypothetical protein
LSGGICVAVRRRRYGAITLPCAAVGIALCLLPLFLSAIGRFYLLDPRSWP